MWARPWLLAVPLAVLGSAAALGRLQSAPGAAAETGLLGLVAAAVLACLASAGARGAALTPALGCVSALALWALPAGEVRAAALAAVLAAGAAATLPGALRRPAPAAVTALAIAFQLLFRSERLIGVAVDGPLLLELVVWPALGALALLAVSRAAGRGVWAGAGALMALAGGVTPQLVVAAALLAAALARPFHPATAARTVAPASRPAPWLWRAGSWTAVALAAAAVSGAWSALLWALPAALACASQRAAAGLPRSAGRRGLLAAGAGLAILLTVFGGGRDGPAALAGWAWLPLLLPGAGCRRESRGAAILAALAALPALATLPPDEALAAPLLLLAATARSGASARLQALWSGVLLSLGASAGGYPWLRARPAEAALAVLGLDASWVSALAVVAVFWILVASTVALARGPRRLAPEVAGGALLLVAALAAALPSGTRALDSPVVLSASQTRAARDLDPIEGARTAIVDSYLSNSLALEPGTEVARVRLHGLDGEVVERSLRFGRETSEWAARRPGVSLASAPSPWIGWLAPDGAYAAQRYRAVFPLAERRAVRRVEIERSSALPAAVEVTIVHLEVR